MLERSSLRGDEAFDDAVLRDDLLYNAFEHLIYLDDLFDQLVDTGHHGCGAAGLADEAPHEPHRALKGVGGTVLDDVVVVALTSFFLSISTNIQPFVGILCIIS